MKNFALKVLKYILIGIIVAPLSIVTHELGHYFVYQSFGAASVKLHVASVSANKESLTNLQIAFANLIGPIISYLTIISAYFITRKTYRPFWIMLAIAAPIGRLVNPIYVYFRALGYNPNPNFDEFNFSRNLGIEPLFLAVLTTVLIFAVFIYFFRKAWIEGKTGEIVLIIVSLAIGVFVWFSIGGIILP